MKICENCGAQKESAVCRECGAAFYDDPRATVRIIPNNFKDIYGSPEKMEERSILFWLPLLDGLIKKSKEELISNPNAG